ncbi:MAG: WalW protein, partial [Gemmatimonadetes bacterium]
MVIVSIDTEEDNWRPSRSGVTLENIGELRPLAEFFRRLGVRPTYFTAYRVAIDSRAADALQDACDRGGGEIAAHLHPWNTPPLLQALVPRNSMLKNLPADLQLAKIERL